MEKQSRYKRDCAACGKPAAVAMEHTQGHDRLTVCESCAYLLTTELVQDAHGSYVRAWKAA